MEHCLLTCLRIPRNIELSQTFGDHLDKSVVEMLTTLRAKVVVMATQESATALKSRRKVATRHGGCSTANLLQALEEYLPALLGLVKQGTKLRNKVQVVLANQEDVAEVTKDESPSVNILYFLLNWKAELLSFFSKVKKKSSSICTYANPRPSERFRVVFY